MYSFNLPSSLAWPRPFPRRLLGGAGGGEEGEGSGDSEQDAVAKWNVIIFRKCNIARDLLMYTILVVNRAHS